AAAGLVVPIGTRVIALVHMRVAGAAAHAVLARADRTVAVSASLTRQLRALGARRVTVIAPGRDALPRVGGTPAASTVLRAISVANWSRVKGIDTLLGALRRVPQARVTFAGHRTFAPSLARSSGCATRVYDTVSRARRSGAPRRCRAGATPKVPSCRWWMRNCSTPPMEVVECRHAE